MYQLQQSWFKFANVLLVGSLIAKQLDDVFYVIILHNLYVNLETLHEDYHFSLFANNIWSKQSKERTNSCDADILICIIFQDGRIDYGEFVAMMQKGNPGIGRRTMRSSLNMSMRDAHGAH